MEEVALRTIPIPAGAAGARVMGALRTIKMVQPRCIEGCQHQGYGWWETCPHDPYFHSTMTDIQEPVLEEKINPTTGESETLVTRMETKRIYDHQPNVSQVALDVSVNSMQGVNKALQRGFKMLEDLGYKPMCQMRGCWKSDLPIRINDGHYCSEEHAKLIKVTKGIGNPNTKSTLLHADPAERRAQLEGIALV